MFNIIYSYDGVIANMTLEADNREKAMEYITQKPHLKVIKIEHIPRKQPIIMWNKIRLKELSIVFYQFSILLNAAIPLYSILENFTHHSHPKIKAMFLHVLNTVKSGKHLSDGFAYFRHELGIGVDLIALGEKSGNLPAVLLLFVEYLQHKEHSHNRLMNAISYPLLLAISMLVALFVIIGFLIPQLESLFHSFNKTLPPLTQFLFSLQILISPYFILFYILFFVGVLLFIILLQNNAKIRLLYDGLLLHIPFIGTLLKSQYCFFYFTTLKLLLTAGFVIDNALELCANTCQNKALRKKLDMILSHLKHGHSMSNAMRNIDTFEPIIIELIHAAELSGEMEKMLHTAADVYGAQFQQKQSQILSAIEPIMTCIMAGFVLLLALGVFLPLWELNIAY